MMIRLALLASCCLALSPLDGRVAVVTGASRGIGRGIAVELGALGATVYVTGRSTRAAGATTERPLAAGVDATLEATCELVARAGGEGVAVACDAADDAQVAALFARVREERGRLDVLVCSAFTTPPSLDDAAFRDDFWKQGAPMWDACHSVGLRGAYVACCEAAPLMIETARRAGAAAAAGGAAEAEAAPRPLIALVSSFGGKSYTFNVACVSAGVRAGGGGVSRRAGLSRMKLSIPPHPPPRRSSLPRSRYGVGKAATDRLAADMSVQLAAHGVDALSLYPGLVRTEGNLEMDARGDWAAASGGLELAQGESPRLSGRALGALATRPELARARRGGVVVVAELAKEVRASAPPRTHRYRGRGIRASRTEHTPLSLPVAPRLSTTARIQRRRRPDAAVDSKPRIPAPELCRAVAQDGAHVGPRRHSRRPLAVVGLRVRSPSSGVHRRLRWRCNH